MKFHFHKLIALMSLILMSAACSGGNGTTIVGNPSITIGQLNEGTSRITIGSDVFDDMSTATLTTGATDFLMSNAYALSTSGSGSISSSSFSTSSSSTITNSTIDIYVNSVLTNEDLSSSTYYHSSSDSVIFDLNSLANGDRLTFIIRSSSSRRAVSYSGTTSESSDSEAVSSEDALADGNLSDAEGAYCDAYEFDNTDSEAAFGCFLTRLMTLPETSDAQTLLTALGEDNIDVETDILNGIFDGFVSDTSDTTDVGFDAFRYTSHVDLPLNDIFTDGSLNFQEKMAQIVVRLAASTTTAEQLQTDITALRDDYEEMEELLDVVLADSSFEFTIPQETFFTSSDLDVSPNDALFFMSFVKSNIVGLNILDAYDLGIGEASSDLLNASQSDFNYEVLAADLNGTGETIGSVTVDTTPFLTMDDESLITGSEERFTDALEDFSTALQTLIDGETSDLFSDSLENANLASTQTLADELLESINTDSEVQITAISTRTVSVNLKEFFTNPPSAADVTSTDPFVADSSSIQLVGSYFSDLLSGIASY